MSVIYRVSASTGSDTKFNGKLCEIMPINASMVAPLSARFQLAPEQFVCARFEDGSMFMLDPQNLRPLPTQHEDGR